MGPQADPGPGRCGPLSEGRRAGHRRCGAHALCSPDTGAMMLRYEWMMATISRDIWDSHQMPVKK